MKVGDIVTRSYVWKPTMMPGLIVSEYVETVNYSDFGPVAYDVVFFEVVWSDSTKTTESLNELFDKCNSLRLFDKLEKHNVK